MICQTDKIHCSDFVLGNTQPFFFFIGILVYPDGFLHRHILLDLFLRASTVCYHIPVIGMGQIRISGIPQSLLSFLRQTVVFQLERIFFTCKVKQDIIHGLSHPRVFGQGLISEASGRHKGKFLPDSIQVLLWISKNFFFTTGKGNLSDRMVLLPKLLVMARCSHRLVFLWCQGMEKPRFLRESGA